MTRLAEDGGLMFDAVVVLPVLVVIFKARPDGFDKGLLPAPAPLPLLELLLSLLLLML